MGRHKSHSPLSVWMNNRRIGLLDKESNGVTRFSYDDNWLDWEHAIPVSLSLPLQREYFSGPLVSDVFENMLPDVDAIRRAIATRVGAVGTDAFSLLAKIGRDCVGALQFLEADADRPVTGKIDAIPLDEAQIEHLLTTLGQTHLGMQSDEGFRISIAGAQEKTALLWHEGKWHKPTGTTPTTHIFKPRIGLVRYPDGTIDLRDSVENEYYCLKLLAAFGLKVPSVNIAQFGDTKVLVVQRFDRTKTADGRLIRVPQEDCCQALSVPPTLKYQSQGGPSAAQILKLLRGSDDRMADQLDFFKSQILFWLIGATDGHGKNFSLYLKPRGGYSLTPFYDVLTAQPDVDTAQLRHRDFKLAMSVGKSRHYDINGIVGRHFLETAKEVDLSPSAVRGVIEEILDDFEAPLQAHQANLPHDFPMYIHDSVANGMRQRIKKLAILT
jgi:serine/threonine-protein kinase HipA